MTDTKSKVRAVLLELIEADGKGTPRPWKPWADEGDRYSLCVDSREEQKHSCVGSFSYRNDLAVEDCKLAALARNLAPGMARIILKMLDDNECNKCQGYGSWKADTSERGPCPRCAERWQEWAGWLGVA